MIPVWSTRRGSVGHILMSSNNIRPGDEVHFSGFDADRVVVIAGISACNAKRDGEGFLIGGVPGGRIDFVEIDPPA